MSARLLLIRHGHVDFTSRDFVQSPRGRQFDPPLSEQGREQARRLAARLSLMDRPTVVATSPFARCLQTLEPYLRAAGLEAEVVEDLGEVFVGEWEGAGFEEIVSGDEDLARRFREQEPMFSLAPGGESGDRLRARVVPAMEALLERSRDGTMVVVTHGGVINAYLGHIMGVHHDMFFLPENASINSVLAEGGRREMRFLNDVRHLTDPGIFAPPAGVGEHASKAGDQPNLPDGILRPARTKVEVEGGRNMGVKFLSDEWANAVQDALNSSESFKSSAGSQTAKVQQVVTGAPEGEVKYWFKLEAGQASLGMGELGEPVDATITQDYDTAEKLAKNELTGTAAYMSGKLRVSGDLMKLMQLQGALSQMPAALKDIEVEY